MQDATKHFINGQWVNSIDGRETAVENPSTEERIATITLGGVADVEMAVTAAKDAFPSWAATRPFGKDRRIGAVDGSLQDTGWRHGAGYQH